MACRITHLCVFNHLALSQNGGSPVALRSGQSSIVLRSFYVPFKQFLRRGIPFMKKALVFVFAAALATSAFAQGGS
ncbi:MAG TPA: hypothetical protein VF713_02990, partial [Thermoanaerobaculia bacterium]